VFDGYPEVNHVPGTGYFPHDVHMSRVYLGYENAIQPIKNAGIGPRQDDGRFGPWLNRAAGNAKVFKATYGHLQDTPIVPGGDLYWYTNWVYHGLKPQLQNPGHIIRKIGAPGAPSGFGYFEPDLPSDNRANPISGHVYGQTEPVGHDDDPYGHNKVNQWFGVDKALKV